MSNLKERILSLKPTKGDEFNDKRTALVDGVYMSNHPIRKKALSYVWARYNMLPDVLTDSLGRLYEIMKENIIPQKNYKGLFDYTHDKSSVYSNTIAEKNLTVSGVCGNTFNGVSETPKEKYKAWHGTSFEGTNYFQSIEDYLANTIDNNTRGLFYTTNSTLLPFNSISYAFENNANIEFQNSIIEKNNNSKPESPKKVKRSEVSNKEWTLYNLRLKTYKKELREWRKNKGERRQQNSDAIRNIEKLNKQPITLVEKTSKLFLDNKIKTLTDKFGEFKDINESTEIDSAIVKGIVSHGRSLLKKNYQDPPKINGYDNPFCRAWACHHQYGSSKDTLIRSSGYTFSDNRFKDSCGVTYDNYSVLKDGFVRITPEKKCNKYDTKSCMFSIENLAWKDVIIENELSKEQQGPNGGRIMWFPPYNLKFQENVNVNWNPTTFIGRGENIYTYTNTDRVGTLSFTMLIDYPSVMDNYFNDGRDKEESEQEILRYFAGCDKCGVVIGDTKSSDDSEKEGSDEEELGANPDDGETLKFNIYFPLNYSGHYQDGVKIDDDWAEYLIWGHDKSSHFEHPDTRYAKGYEISETGLNQPSLENTCSAITHDEGYKYRVDKNSNKQNTRCNYVDYKSYGLNSKADGENTVSFLSFYTFLKSNDSNVRAWGVKNEIFEEDLFKEKKLNEIKKDDLSGCTITITPYTSDQNRKITDNLAKKRADTVKDFLKKYINTEKIEIKNAQKGGYSKNNDRGYGANGKESKEGRRVEVEIKYNKAIIEGSTPQQQTSNIKTQETKLELKYNYSNNMYKKYNESDYFKQIREKDNFLYEKIIDKVKYFEPAYHSLSPEGFNGRLNFLHQCTRQGHTIEIKAGDKANTNSTAWNMAFGRPPVCVLRIGDFINTKILIQSMSITYENGNGIQWDLNPEGIGVQPMFANINLGIILIGGQSIDAPISRLNNAVSFNYYANTKTYDNRADFGMYVETGVTYDEFYIVDKK